MPFKLSQIPVITGQMMQEAKRLMMGRFGVLPIQIMEMAGRHVADLAQLSLDHSAAGKQVAICIGGSSIGGKGIVAARHLYNRGACVSIIIDEDRPDLDGLSCIQNWPVDVISGPAGLKYLENKQFDLVVDALVGSEFDGELTTAEMEMIELINKAKGRKLSVEVPSGLCLETGAASKCCVRAECTITFGLPKIGLMIPEAKEYVGDLYLGDICIPDAIFQELGVDVDHIFIDEPIIELDEKPQKTFRSRCTGFLLG